MFNKEPVMNKSIVLQFMKKYQVNAIMICFNQNEVAVENLLQASNHL